MEGIHSVEIYDRSLIGTVFISPALLAATDLADMGGSRAGSLSGRNLCCAKQLPFARRTGIQAVFLRISAYPDQIFGRAGLAALIDVGLLQLFTVRLFRVNGGGKFQL